MTTLSQLNWPLNILLGARGQNIWIHEGPWGLGARSIWLLHLLSEHLFPTIKQGEISRLNHYCHFPSTVELTLQISTFQSLKEEAMCIHPMNHMMYSAKSAVLPFLLLIFMSKQIFQILFNLNLNHGVGDPTMWPKTGRVTHQIRKLSSCILPNLQWPVSTVRENIHLAGLRNRLKLKEKKFLMKKKLSLAKCPSNHYNLRCSLTYETNVCELGENCIHDWILKVRFSVAFCK